MGLLAVVVLAAAAPTAVVSQSPANSVYKGCIDVNSRIFERSGEAVDVVSQATLTKCEAYLSPAVDELISIFLANRPPNSIAPNLGNLKAQATDMIATNAKKTVV